MSRPATCPACGCEVSRIDIRPWGFPCPYCDEPLEIDARIGYPIAVVSVILAAYLSDYLGYSGGKFILGTVLMGLGMFLFAALLNRWFWLRLIRADSGVDFRITGPRDEERKQRRSVL